MNECKKILDYNYRSKVIYLRNNIVDDNCSTTVPYINMILDDNHCYSRQP